MPVINTAITVSFQVRNATNGAPITGDAANLTLRIVKDGVASTPTNSPVEVALGEYKLALTTGENSGELMGLIGTSSTTNAIIIPARWQNIDATIASRAAPSDFATLEGRLTATRAGYLDNLNGLGDLSNLANLDVAVSTRATPGNLAAIVSLVEISGGTMRTGEAIELIRGDARTLTMALTDDAGDPIDLTGYVGGNIKLTVKKTQYRSDTDDANAAFQVTGTFATPANGIVTFAISPANSETLETGINYDYDIQADDGAGGIVTYARGTLKLAFDVTRTGSATPT